MSQNIESNSAKVNYADLLPPSWTRTIAQWIDEDCPSFDYGGAVVGTVRETATLYCKSDVRNKKVQVF